MNRLQTSLIIWSSKRQIKTWATNGRYNLFVKTPIERYNEIDRENKILLNKMTKIMEKTNSLFNINEKRS